MPKSEVYLNKKYHETLQKVADKKGVTKAAVLNEILENFGLSHSEPDYKPVVLQIPLKHLKDDREGLEYWLGTRTAAIVDIFYPENNNAINS